MKNYDIIVIGFGKAGKTPGALNVIENWAEKNKINIKKVNETTHYILGKNI